VYKQYGSTGFLKVFRIYLPDFNGCLTNLHFNHIKNLFFVYAS